ncbi:ribonuclease h2 subunit b [Holotrichia oblita]|uniref:Ribonuclease h2 subunit b n=1 Tax=Holotrichia oblita TaxID=644536 RepID=A0ACB9THW5_HOLOL|nr:ribonuclease h2 subunit b [Holotrichia oblita]
MPRNNDVSASNGQSMKSNVQQPCNSWVFLLKELNPNGTDYENDVVHLRHPNSGDTGAFLFSKDNKYVQEILTYVEHKRSWFIDDSVRSDGTLKISTPIDPVFLVLPYLRNNSTNSSTLLDQLLHDEIYPETERLLQCDGLKSLTCVADKTVAGDITAYKYNESKALTWLKRKTDNLVKILKSNNIHLTSDATSATFKKTNSEQLDDNVYVRYAVEIVSEYLPADLSEKLVKHLNLPEVVSQIKRKSDIVDVRDTKKHKSTVKETSPVKTTKPAIARSAKPRSATSKSKTANTSGSTNRTITSFFKKK